MKKKLYVIIMSFFALVFIIAIIFLPFYNPIYFYIQHVSLFLFATMFILFMLKLGLNRLESTVRDTKVVKVFTVVMFGIVLFAFSELQLLGIDMYQTPGTQSCSYYDKYDNAVYYSQLRNECPELEVIEDTPTTFSFIAYEEAYGVFEGTVFDFDSNGWLYKGKLRTDTFINYDDKGRITRVVTKSSTNILLYNEEDEQKLYNTRTVIVKNLYLNTDFFQMSQGVLFRSMKTEQIVSEQLVDYEDYETVEHLTGFEFEETKTIYDARKIMPIAEATDKSNKYQVVLREQIYDKDGDLVETIHDDGIFRILNVSCFDTSCEIEHGNVESVNLVGNNEIYELQYINKISITDNMILNEFKDHTGLNDNSNIASIKYTKLNGYGLVIDETFSGLTSVDIKSTRKTFVYRGIDYVEIDDKYMKIYIKDYGLKVVNILLEDGYTGDDYEGSNFNISQLLSSRYPTKHDISNIFDYKVKLFSSINKDDFLYQTNPLIHESLHYYIRE